MPFTLPVCLGLYIDYYAKNHCEWYTSTAVYEEKEVVGPDRFNGKYVVVLQYRQCQTTLQGHAKERKCQYFRTANPDID